MHMEGRQTRAEREEQRTGDRSILHARSEPVRGTQAP